MRPKINERQGNIIYRLTLAAVFWGGFLAVSWLPFKTFCLFFGLAFPLQLAVDAISAYLPPIAAGRASRNLSGSIAMIAASIYHLAYSSSILWKAFAWLCFAYALLAFVTSGMRVFIDSIVLIHLKRSYARGVAPNYYLPTLYVVGEPGRGAWAANRLVGRLGRALWQEHYLRGGSSLIRSHDLRTRLAKRFTETLALRGRISVYCIESAALGSQTQGLRSFLIGTAHAFVAVTLAPAWREAPASRDDANTLWSAFWDETEEGWLHCSGPTFEIQINPFGASPVRSAERADTFVGLPWPSLGRSLNDAVAPVLQRIANNCVPMARADSSLDDLAREVSRRLGRYALPPIADAYLKVRLAQSDVERLNSLLDAIEALVRFAAVALLVEHWSQGSLINKPELNTRRVQPLTFGGWQHVLSLALSDSPTPSLMGTEVRRFFHSDITPCQLQLKESVAAAGLGPSEVPFSSQSQWVKWIVWLRNMTKGHGPVDENLAGRLWEDLHTGILAMAAGLDYLVTKSALVVLRADAAQLLGGWYRGGKRAFAEPLDSQARSNIRLVTDQMSSLVYLRSPNREILPLSPLIQCDSDDVLMWSGSWSMSDSGEGEAPHLELLSNATALRAQAGLKSIVLFENWREKKSRSEFAAIQRLVREGPP